MTRRPLRRSRSLIVGGATALVLVVALPWMLSARGPVDGPEVPATTEMNPGTAAMRVSIDPETGTLVHAPATADKAADHALQRMLSRSTEGLKEVVHPDGHVSVVLEGRFMSASVAHIGDDGTVATTCTENPDQARNFMAGETTPSADQMPEVK